MNRNSLGDMPLPAVTTNLLIFGQERGEEGSKNRTTRATSYVERIEYKCEKIEICGIVEPI